MTIKERLRNRRVELGMTLEDVAQIVGVTRATILKYENGLISNIPSDKIEALARALQTTPSQLMGWEDEMLAYITEEHESGRVSAKRLMYQSHGLDHNALTIHGLDKERAILYYQPSDALTAQEQYDLISTFRYLDFDSIYKIRCLVQAYLRAGAPIQEIVDTALKPYVQNGVYQSDAPDDVAAE